jgi:DNA-binding transcriptional LysR family regulator
MQWAVAGLGIVNTPSFLIGNELEDGRLETILDEYAASNVGVYVVRPPGTAVPAKVRTLIDNLITHFQAEQL